MSLLQYAALIPRPYSNTLTPANALNPIRATFLLRGAAFRNPHRERAANF
jgi:hypothetical protein